MVYEGIVSGGVVVLKDGVVLPEGTAVKIEPVEAQEDATLGQRLLKHAGVAKGLPTDMARNHDHYLHGAPRR